MDDAFVPEVDSDLEPVKRRPPTSNDVDIDEVLTLLRNLGQSVLSSSKSFDRTASFNFPFTPFECQDVVVPFLPVVNFVILESAFNKKKLPSPRLKFPKVEFKHLCVEFSEWVGGK